MPRRRWIRWLAWALATIVVALVAAYLALQTSEAKRLLAAVLQELLSSARGVTVSIEGLDGRLPGSVRAERVVLRDSHGVWLVAEHLEIAVAPAELLAGRIRVKTADIGRVDLYRLPQVESEEPSTPGPPLTLIVDQLRVPAVSLGSAASRPESTPPAAPLPVGGALRDLTASGRISLSNLQARIRFAADKDDGSGLLPDEAAVRSGPIHIEGAVNGWLVRPNARVKVDARTVVTPAASAERLQATATAKPMVPDRKGSGWALKLDARASWPSAPSLPPGMLGEDLHLEATGHVPGGEEPTVLEVDALEASSGSIDLRAQGAWSADALALSDVHVAGIDLSALASTWSVAVEGSLSVVGALRYDLDGEQLTASAHASASGFESDAQWMRALLGANPVAGAKIRVERDGDVTAEDITIEAAAGRAGGRIEREAASGALDVAADATMASLAALSPLVGAALAGTGTVHVTVQGPPKRLQAHASWEASEVSLRGSEPAGFRGAFDAAGTWEQASGRLQAGVVVGDERIDLAATGALDPSVLRVERLSASGGGIDLGGSLRLQRSSGLVDGRVGGKIVSFATLARLLGLAVTGRMQLEAVARSRQSRQELDLHADANALHVFGSAPVEVRASQATIEASLRKPAAAVRGRVELSARAASIAGVSLDDASLTAVSEGDDWQLTSSASGSYNEPFEVRAAGTFSDLDEGWRLRVTTLQGLLAEQAVALDAPCTISSAATTKIDGLALTIGEGSVRGSGEWGSEQLHASLDAARLPLRLARLYESSWHLQGTVDARLHASGPRRAPDITLQGQVAGARLEGADHADVPPFAAKLNLERKGRDIRADVVLDDERGTRFEADVRAGAATPADGEAAGLIDPSAPLHARVEGRADAALLADLARLGEERMSGRVDATLGVEGTLERPRVNGRVVLSDGTYLSAYSGAVLHDLTATLSGEGTRLVLEELSGRDDNGGKLRGKGAIDFSAGLSRARYRADVVLDGLRVAQLDAFSATTDGQLALLGEGDRCALKGGLGLRTVDVVIPDQLPPHVIDLDVVEIGGAAPANGHEGTPSEERFTMDLDLALDLPNRGYIRGRGLDSEWKGKAHVGGTLKTPIYEGKFKLVRGTFGLLGVPFKVTSGRVDLDGGSTVDPVLDVTAEAQRNAILGKVTITGRASRPRITLSSVPPLPSDQVLSQLVFGQSPGKLSALQSVQLAEGLAQLSGNRAGPDILGDVRSTLGLDRLGLTSEGQGVGGSILSVGKYVGEGVYLSVNQGLTNASSKASVEIELTPNLRLGSEVGVDAAASLGLTWRYDY